MTYQMSATCIICGIDITDEVKQFGLPFAPMCQSDWLNGEAWIYDEPIIIDALKRGIKLEDAKKIAIKGEISDLEKFALQFFEAIS